MKGALSIVLFPVIWGMEQILDAFVWGTSSPGVSILFLSLLISILFIPVSRIGRKIESKTSQKMADIDKQVKELKKTLKGEELFFATEAIYKRENFHPIQSIYLGASLWFLLPVLISAIFLFTEYRTFDGVSFLFLSDLSKPDQLVFGLNILPLIMFLVTFVDAKLRYSDDSKRKIQFLLISIVLTVLVYSMPASLVLYWTMSNAVSLAFTVAR